MKQATHVQPMTNDELDEINERVAELHRIAYQQARKTRNTHEQSIKIADDVVKEYRREQSQAWRSLDTDAFWTSTAIRAGEDGDL